MANTALVLHTRDGESKAYELCKILNANGIDSSHIGSTFGKTERDSSETLVRQLIDDWDTIVIVVSPGLFASCALRFGIAYALGKGKPLVSVEDRSPFTTLVPTWFHDLFPKNYTEAEILTKLREVLS